MIKCALFDLDGTLVNTLIDLGLACDYVLKQYNIEPKWTQEDYQSFVGNGAKKLLDRAFDNKLDNDELDKALSMFMVKYNEILLDNAYIYDGIKEQLDLLKQNNIKLAVVTNKPDKAAQIMVTSLFGDNYFDCITGAVEDKPKKPDPYTTNLTLKKLGCKSNEAIFFGDSDIDIYTAKNAKIEAVGCSWGFRSFECLMSASPSVIIDDPKYIFKLF